VSASQFDSALSAIFSSIAPVTNPRHLRWFSKENPMATHEKEANQHGNDGDGGKKAKMAPQPSAPPGLEQDSNGNVIPFDPRTKDDQEKTRRG
jgi:hypothetical protein